VPVAPDVQAAISQRYAQLATAVLNGDKAAESAVLAPHFRDRAKITLASFEYDPLTVMVEKMDVRGPRLEVHAKYVGVHGHTVETIDYWQKIDGAWRLSQRD
jgi:hypothetical protein